MTIIHFENDVFRKIPNDQPGYYNWIGRESHYLTVVDAYMRVTEGKSRQRYFMCKCRCGNEKLVHGDGIRRQRIKSCGCWKSVVDAKKAKDMGTSNKTHGLSRSRIYKIWDLMISRCHNTNDKDYKNYGGRGIEVCDKWHKFEGFYEDMKNGYTNKMTIDRIDVNGDYTKSNCRWSTMLAQQSNKRNTIYIEYDGKKMLIKEWAKLTGMPDRLIRARHKYGWSSEQIFNTPVGQKRKQT